jgi:thioredoxin-like negative regulator of GroEL
MLESSDKTLSEDLRRAGRRAVLVFWAPWARQCKDVVRFCSAAAQVAGEEAVIALNTDINPVTAHSHHVQRVPMVQIIADGSVVWSTEGLPEPEDLKTAWQTASAKAISA